MISRHGTPLEPSGEFVVLIAGGQVTIPYRIYNQIPEPSENKALSETAQTALHCLFTRHHDGYARHRSVSKVLDVPYGWVVPYVVQLIGEYVIEIHQAIYNALSGLASTDRRVALYAEFVTENPEFLDLTKQRAISYWNCYYRRRYPDRTGYPAFELLKTLDRFRQ